MAREYPECTGDNTLRLVDVGGRGGLQAKWHPYEQNITAILFEPAPDSASELRRLAGGRHTVLEVGLSNVDAPRSLFVTHNPLCSSLHEPNDDVLRHYGIWRPHFEVVGRQEVSCRRYDSLHYSGNVPSPDAIKIDTQGHEYEVLEGFGGLLSGCLGVELETHFYQTYRAEKIFHQIVELMTTYDFVLRRVEPAPTFNGDLVEANAYFTKPRHVIAGRPVIDRLKHDLLCEVWSLERYAIDSGNGKRDALR